jgi:CheY-like chemotaxis protein
MPSIGDAAVTVRLLIVEDHRDNRESLGLLFEAAGYEVYLADSGERGIALATAHEPDIVLLDLGLPGLQGEQVAMILKAAAAPPFIIAYSGYERLEREALAAGCDAFVVKPGLDTLATLLAGIDGGRAVRRPE